MRAFTGLLKPLQDETLSSWLSRMRLRRYFDFDFESESLRIAARDPYVKGDPDLLYKSPTFLKSFDAAQQMQIVKHFQMPELHLTPVDASDKYCPVCFQEDIAALHTPVWRKAWRIRGACVCLRHNRPVLLSRVVKNLRDVRDKGWQGFQEYLESPASRLDINFALLPASPSGLVANNTKLLMFTARVQHWYQRRMTEKLDAETTFSALQFLMGLWLHPADSTQLGSGIARSYFHQLFGRSPRISTSEMVSAPSPSIDTASPRDMAVAYWLLGAAYEVISQEEASLISKVTRSASLAFPTTRMQVASVTTRNYLEEGLNRLIGEASASLSSVEFRSISWVFVRLLTPKD